jgi:surface polysaccharide O-acyltransferase-like enzyme
VNRNISLDTLKLVMAFMVVGLHAGFLETLSPLGNFLTTQGLFRIAVPIFLIINGYFFFTVLKKHNHYSWLKRVMILYSIWMIIYSYFWFSLTDISLIGFTKLFAKLIIGYHHLWYISGLIGAAMLLLLLRNMSSIILWASIVLTFLFGVFIQYSGNYHLFPDTALDKLFNLNVSHRNALFFSYPFFCFGYLINKHSLHKRITLKYSTLLALLGSVVLLSESYINYLQPSNGGSFDNYITLILVCPAIFILFINLNISGDNKDIALYSSAIYFIHSLLLSAINEFTDFNGTISTFTVLITSLIASFFIVKLSKKFKFIL